MTLARAASEVEASNGALAHIGEGRITSLDETRRTAARIIKTHFGSVRDTLLRRHDWNFARRWATLAQDPAAPAGTFAFMYPLPADCIRVRIVQGASEDDWCVENGSTAAADGETGLTSMLSTGLVSPRIGYTAMIGNPALWDATFLEAFEFALAAKIAPQLGRDDALADSMRANAEAVIMRARKADAREQAPSRVPREVSYISVRRGGWA
ncbi:MAG: hypothetical protein IOB85_15230 [Methylobacterium sp.]|nr:hypothetical protein [Methylobacterium sp.]MCA3665860.1 hypothetical protein [Methylobacterium sp.]MCA3668140.1 hypothetical protein [Methylobacterium sp.]MCA3675525.1 hypothetical protein [Methylobacterium sp.]MCA3679155.1 hypothetical protein [Methylobacterium sp.]